MQNENETVAEIVKEMRDRNEVRKVRLRQYGGVQCNCAIAPDDVPAVYADLIEAAHRREVAEKQEHIDMCVRKFNEIDMLLHKEREKVAELQRLLKVAEDALKHQFEILCDNCELEETECEHCARNMDYINAIAAIREEGGAK